MDGARRTRPTARGTGLAVLGVVALLGGLLGGGLLLVQVGALLVLTVAVGTGWLLLEARAQGRGGLTLVRHVEPHPVTVGTQAVVRVEVTTNGGSHRLDRLGIAERAARELSGSTPLRARVHRAADRLTLVYAVRPEARGRWAVGPLEVQRRDLFDVARWRGPLGERALIAVRPVVTPLSITNRASSTDVDRAASGARTPAPDDSSLRDYQIGDDLRRVHWRSSARRGELVVRQDERSGRRPASVLLDLPTEHEAAEWSISVAASIALALVAASHHVRLLGGDVHTVMTDHHRPDADGRAEDALLDQTVDLVRPPTAAVRTAWLRTAVDTLGAQTAGSELVFAVLGVQDADGLAGLARLGATSRCWAMVRTGGGAGGALGGGTDTAPPTPEETRTLDSLRRSGWTVCAVRPGEDTAGAWARLLESDERLVTRR